LNLIPFSFTLNLISKSTINKIINMFLNQTNYYNFFKLTSINQVRNKCKNILIFHFLYSCIWNISKLLTFIYKISNFSNNTKYFYLNFSHWTAVSNLSITILYNSILEFFTTIKYQSSSKLVFHILFLERKIIYGK
jgi:hypothetical protein